MKGRGKHGWASMGKTAQFLKELRCEDTGRLHSYNYQSIKRLWKKNFHISRFMSRQFVKWQMNKCVIEKYVGLTEQCAEEENQQAYLQGMVDMLLLLSGSGILKVPSNMLEKIKQWKWSSGSCMCMDRFANVKTRKKLDKIWNKNRITL